MPQVFRRRANNLAKASILGGVLFLGVLAGFGFFYARSSYSTMVGIPRNQPVPFSHKHHVGDDGIDCRYCHTSVEESAFAGIPPTQICMNCHTQIWSDSPMLAPVRDSFQTGKSLEWTRVYNLPGFVYFNHSIHVNKGVGCETCHGRVDQMPLTWRANTLLMEWCLNCHRAPEQYIRPREFITTMGYTPAEDQVTVGRKLVKEYKIHDARYMTSCSTCHR